MPRLASCPAVFAPVVLIAALLSPAASAEPEPADRPVTLFGGVEVRGAPSGAGPGVGAGLLWHAHPRVGLLLSAHEAGLWGPGRLLGTLTLAAALPLRPWLRATLGVVHTHEVALDDAKAAPIGALLGTLSSMTHRSGLHAGLRAEYRTPDLDRFGPYVTARAEVHPDGHGPPVYGAFELGLALDVGRRRAPTREVADRTR